MDKETKEQFENLANLIQEGFKTADEKTDEKFKMADERTDEKFKMADERTDEKIESLARMIKRGFDENIKEHQEIFKTLDKLDILEQGEEDIKLKLDNVAYRFELRELEQRVQRCELKLGLAKA